MSAPFGGHPNFATYLVWALKNGCSVQSVLGHDADGTPCALTKITAPSGRWVFETMEQTEHMTPTTIWRLDRRLGVTSPFFSINPDTGETSGTP